MSYKLHKNDAWDILPTLQGESVDSVVTDPPYGLGFMGKDWDSVDTPFRADFWREVMRVLKPGGYLLAFGGTRTYHRMASAVEDAGFEVRDQIQWLFGSGFPKSRNCGGGWGTALKPANEPILLARKPLSERNVAANVLAHGTGAINVDGCRVATDEKTSRPQGRDITGGQWGGGGHDKRSTLTTGGDSAGRFPANVIHDGSNEVVEAFAAFGESKSVGGDGSKFRSSMFGMEGGCVTEGGKGYGDIGTPARFFYSAKASKRDRMCGDRKTTHPTVKPISLMAYLCRLITPPGGTVLDPFAGSGTTLQAAVEEGFHPIGIEREPEYQADIEARMAAATENLGLFAAAE